MERNRNTGVMLARGVFVWPIDADDFLARRLLSTLTHNMNEHLPTLQAHVFFPMTAFWFRFLSPSNKADRHLRLYK